MSYPNAHLLLTAHWGYSSTATEFGQTGLRFDSTSPATQALVDAAATAWSNFWTNSTMGGIDPAFRLQYLRLASIGTDGKYVPGTIAYDHLFPGGTPGAAGGSTPLYRFPLQIACVTSLLTAFARGQAYKGRMYLPQLVESPLQASWTWTTANCNNRSNAVAAMISALNTVMPGDCTIFSKGTKAAPGVGAKHLVTGCLTDTKPDVQRRRAKQLPSVLGAVNTITT